jgi:hypothetical protein
MTGAQKVGLKLSKNDVCVANQNGISVPPTFAFGPWLSVPITIGRKVPIDVTARLA